MAGGGSERRPPCGEMGRSRMALEQLHSPPAMPLTPQGHSPLLPLHCLLRSPAWLEGSSSPRRRQRANPQRELVASGRTLVRPPRLGYCKLLLSERGVCRRMQTCQSPRIVMPRRVPPASTKHCDSDSRMGQNADLAAFVDLGVWLAAGLSLGGLLLPQVSRRSVKQLRAIFTPEYAQSHALAVIDHW